MGAGLDAPRLSTKEMLPPEFIQSQCSAYHKMLDTQLSVGMHALNTQYNLSLNAVRLRAAKVVADFSAEIDLEAKEQMQSWIQNHAEQAMSFEAQAAEQRQDVEDMATEHIFNYRTHKLEEEIYEQQEDMERNHTRRQSQLEDEMNAIAQQAQ